jgi:RNA recognition motif-containing protein
MAKIYVGNLPFTATEDQVRALFAAHGTVESVALPNDRETGRPRGFGFVEMSQGGDEAMAALDGAQVGGRTLKVNEAKPREDRGRGSGGGGGYGGFQGNRW